LIHLVQATQGDTYSSGAGGFAYQDLQAFEQAGIRVERSCPEFPEYPQLWGPFVPGLSVLDLLFNCGPASRTYLETSRRAIVG
jgi:WbqC-like protein